MADPHRTEYEQSLEALDGNDFQDEVSAYLQGVIIDFQVVPANPQGDAGLDGFSHHGERAYCCYGLEHNTFKNNKEREDATVEKFRSDLRRLYELDTDGKTKLVVKENKEIKTILPDGMKIKHVELIVNWFGSHRILNRILSAHRKYAQTSLCRFIEVHATVIVVGPKQLANRHFVDEVMIARARQRVFVQKIEKKAVSVVLGSTEKFDKKMKDLRDIVGSQKAAVDALQIELQTDWRMALAFDRELSDTLPNIHRSFEGDRRRILANVSQLMVSSPKPWTELLNATKIAFEILDQDFGKLYGLLIRDVSSGEIARLIGECPVGWEKAAGDAGTK
jgi:hypothetical protein